ncbi:hypothetical protein [Streptomyces sp. NPDC020141]|uniref:hypothetical protein n=1 Tax=Streptomyces sp. NPDC020141 TaxID=3365065 RepID=UPI0037A42C9E
MAEQIIQQPDGRFAIFSSVTDTFIFVNGTPDEIVAFRVEEAAERAREQARRELDFVTAGNPRGVYRQFALTWDDAARRDQGASADVDES